MVLGVRFRSGLAAGKQMFAMVIFGVLVSGGKCSRFPTPRSADCPAHKGKYSWSEPVAIELGQ